MKDKKQSFSKGKFVLHKRPRPEVINREVPVFSKDNQFYYADYEGGSNKIFNFVPVWMTDSDKDSHLYNVSENYDSLFPIIESHELQHWHNEQIDNSDFSAKDYLVFHVLNEISAHAVEIYNAVTMLKKTGKWEKSMLTLHPLIRTKLKNKIPQVGEDDKFVWNLAFESMLNSEYEKDIMKMAMRSIRLKKDFKNNQVHKDINKDLMKCVWKHHSKLHLFDGEIVDLEKLSINRVYDWINSSTFAGFQDQVANFINKTKEKNSK
ncbi:MAG: hypothetical protein WC137_01810 [Alphaproteobacteria bacterium]